MGEERGLRKGAERGEKREREKREGDKRELRRQLEEEEGLKEMKQFTWTSNHKEVTSTFHDEVIHIIFASHKYNFMINYSHHFFYQLPLLGFCK